MIKKAKYNSLDIVKFFMAICVIAIHTNPFFNCANEVIQAIYQSVIGLAVPFFFLSSGFLLGVKMEQPFSSTNNVEVLKKYVIKILKLYIIWSIIYLPLAICDYVNNHYSFIKSIVHYIRGFVLVGEHYNSWVLWYLLSTIYTVLALIILFKKNVSLKVVLCIGAIVILFGFGIDVVMGYNGTFPRALVYFKKAVSLTFFGGKIFQGAFYIPCGILLSKKNLPIKLIYPAFVLFFILNCAINNQFVTNVLLVICSVMLFEIVKSIKLKENRIYPFARNISTYMYFVHLYVWSAYYYIVYKTKTFGLDSFLATMIISIVISAIIVVIKEKMNNKKTKKS